MKATKPWNNRRFIGTFDVENTTKGDSGRYRCIVHSDKGVGVSNYGELTIKRKCRSFYRPKNKKYIYKQQQSRNAAILSQRTPPGAGVFLCDLCAQDRSPEEMSRNRRLLFSPDGRIREEKRPPQRGLLKIQAVVLC